MNLRTLRTFVEVVRRGGFSQAAQAVSLTQSSVSKAVRSLEDELGVALLNRVGHKSELTAAGQITYRRALALLAEKNALMDELDALRGLKRGTLRIGLPPVGCGALFARLFALYRSRYADIDIELVEYGSSRLKECLEAGDIDIAALLMPIDDLFEYQSLRSEPLVVVMQDTHVLAKAHSLDFSSLASSAFILFEAGFALNRIILDACERRKIYPKVAARSAQIDFIVDLVGAGLGVAFLPKMLAQEHLRPGIVYVALDEADTDWHIALAWRKNVHLPPAALAWLDLAKTLHAQPPPSP